MNPLKTFRQYAVGYLKIRGVEEKIFDEGKRQFRYYEGGEGNPQTVLLLHGFGGNALFTWLRLLPTLSKKYHVLAPDLLASQFLTLSPRSYSIDSELQRVLHFLHVLKIEKTHVVGLSAGGWVGLLMALEDSDRVDKLILINSAGLDFEVPAFAKLVITDREKAKEFFSALFHHPPPIPGFVIDKMVKNSTLIQGRYLQILDAFIENSRARVLDGRLSEIHHSTLMINGKYDQVVPPQLGQRLHQGIARSQSIILEDSGHAAVWDAPAELERAILDFLKKP